MTITAQIENYTDCLDELRPMHHEHWLQLGPDRDKVPLDPQYDVYLQCDKDGKILLATLRENGELAGYFIGFVTPGLHYKTCLTLTMDIFWIREESRDKELGGVKLFRAAFEEAKRLGVQRIVCASKTHQDASRLFEFLKMEKIETHYSKWIGD